MTRETIVFKCLTQISIIEICVYKLPSDINIDDSGRAYIADSGNNRILVVDLPSGEFICEIGHEEGEGKLFNPTGLHLAAEFLYVSDDDNCRNVIYSTSGELIATMHRETGGGTPFFKGPCKFTADINGHIYSTKINFSANYSLRVRNRVCVT